MRRKILEGSVARRTRSRMAVSWIAVVALLATAVGVVTAENRSQEWSSCGRVWVTIHSPERRVGLSRVLDAVELNWDFRGCAVPRQIGLFNNHRPANMNTAQVLFNLNNAQTGHVVTSISLGAGTLPAGWANGPGTRGPHCLWPWAGAGEQNRIQAVNCLKIQPTWMQDHAARINPLRIGDLVVPGTHNSGSWRFDTENNQAARDSLVLCQDRSIWGQLVHGIRYFDMRIAYYGNQAAGNRYWVNHGQIRVRPLVPILRELRRFLDATREVVFFDAHHFPVGFYDNSNRPIWNVHNGLMNLMQIELGPHIAAANVFGTGAGTRGPTVQRLQNYNRRLVFSYIDLAVVAQNNWLWPRLPHLWANTNDVNTLFNFLSREINNSPRPGAPSPLFAAMAQTTPSALDIILLRGNLRENADAVNRRVTWTLVSTWRARANIIASDFFLGNDVVDQSIAISTQRRS